MAVRSRRVALKLKRIAINKRLTSSTSAAEILSIYQHDGNDFDSVNLATAIHRLGRNGASGHRSDPRLGCSGNLLYSR
jgi:hypothetical protein